MRSAILSAMASASFLRSVTLPMNRMLSNTPTTVSAGSKYNTFLPRASIESTGPSKVVYTRSGSRAAMASRFRLNASPTTGFSEVS